MCSRICVLTHPSILSSFALRAAFDGHRFFILVQPPRVRPPLDENSHLKAPSAPADAENAPLPTSEKDHTPLLGGSDPRPTPRMVCPLCSSFCSRATVRLTRYAGDAIAGVLARAEASLVARSQPIARLLLRGTQALRCATFAFSYYPSSTSHRLDALTRYRIFVCSSTSPPLLCAKPATAETSCAGQSRHGREAAVRGEARLCDPLLLLSGRGTALPPLAAAS